MVVVFRVREDLMKSQRSQRSAAGLLGLVESGAA